MEGDHRGLSRRERRYVDEMAKPVAERWLSVIGALGPVVVLGAFGGVRDAGWAVSITVVVAFCLVLVLGLDVVRRWHARRA